MNEKNKLTNGSQSNQSENNYSNSNSLNYNNSENNSSNQYYFEEENYNNNRNFENYNYNNQEQYYNNNYDSNYPNNSNYNGNNSQNPYYNNSYNQNIDENNNQFLYDNQGQYPNYDNNFDENNEQIFYNNQEQFPNYNNDFNGNSEQVFYNNQEQFPHYNNAFNGNNEQGFYNNQEQYSNVVQNGSVSYQNTNPILTDVPQEETHTSSNNNFESVNTQQETQNTQDILMARELQKDQKFDENQEYHDSQDPSDGDKTRKSKLGIIIASIIGLIVLLSVGGYFAYNHIYKNKEIAVNMSQYELEFTANGTEGEGKPSANVKNIPNVDNASDELKQLLQNPKISYDKNDNLRNGDKVEVTKEYTKINGKVNSGEILVDGLGVGDIGSKVIKDRQQLSEDGIVIVAYSIDKNTGKIKAYYYDGVNVFQDGPMLNLWRAPIDNDILGLEEFGAKKVLEHWKEKNIHLLQHNIRSFEIIEKNH